MKMKDLTTHLRGCSEEPRRCCGLRDKKQLLRSAISVLAPLKQSVLFYFSRLFLLMFMCVCVSVCHIYVHLSICI